MDDSLPQRRCTLCGTLKSATTEFFHAGKNYPYGVRAQCKECLRVKDDKRRHRKKPQDEEGRLQCSVCKQWFPGTTEYFFARRDRKLGLHSQCKMCSKPQHVYKYQADTPVTLKRCTKCQIEKPATLEYFSRGNTSPGGLRSWCKACCHAEKHVYDRSHKEQRRISGQRRYLRIRDKHRIYTRNYRIAHQEHMRAHAKAYRLAHLERARERSRNHALTHRQERRASVRNYRARKRAIAGIHTPEQITEQLKRQKDKCYYCGAKLGKGKHAYHVDHTFPLSRMIGTDIPVNSIDYLVITCPCCNASKGNKFPWEWPEGGRLL